MRLLVSWLRDFVDVSASVDDIAATLGVRGFEVAAIERIGADDGVIDFEVTANRPDALSVLGLAREVATAYTLPVRLPSRDAGARIPLTAASVGENERLAITLQEPELCPRYAAAVATMASTVSPAWMTARLSAAGVRPISAIVDVTNYVLIELGQPMHAFDLDRIAGAELRIRRAKPGEVIRTLDGVERKLDHEMLVIADADRAQAVAGVMGGAASEVSAATKRVALESAYFKATSVRRTSKRLGLKTEASARFERGADIEMPVAALERAIALMTAIGAGSTTGPIVDRYPAPRQPARIHLRRARLAMLLGVGVPDADVVRILRGLGLTVADAGDGWDAVAPSFRVDLTREADLIEEVGRHYGYDNIPATFPPVTAMPPAPDAQIARERLVRDVLRASGLSEAVTFGFIEARPAQAVVSWDPIKIANPLSAKFDTLRPSLIPGLIASVAHNRRHGRNDVGLFEVGTRFSAAGETRALGIAWIGSATPVHWSGGARPVDFFDVKGAVEQVCRACDVPVGFTTVDDLMLAPGRAAAAGSHDIRLGIVGQLAPAVAEQLGLTRRDEVYVAEIDLDALSRARAPHDEAVSPLPRHPFVVRDLSIVVPERLSAEIIRGTILAAARGAAAPLAGVEWFDLYRGKGVGDGRVSVSVRLTFQAPDRTLTDAEVQASFDAILAALVREHGAVQR